MTLEKTPKSPLPVVHAAEQAAAMVGANPHYVTDAKKIEQDAPEIFDYVKLRKAEHSPSQESGRIAGAGVAVFLAP
jgi:hypothetical protein